MNIKTDYTIEMHLQRVLAERLYGDSSTPEETLKRIFDVNMKGLEEITKITFERELKERIWNFVSAEKLANLKESFILKVSEKVLGGFKEDELTSMIEEHQETGIIKHEIYSLQLETLFRSSRNLIHLKVILKANAICRGWIPEILKTLEIEGIELPKLH